MNPVTPYEREDAETLHKALLGYTPKRRSLWKRIISSIEQTILVFIGAIFVCCVIFFIIMVETFKSKPVDLRIPNDNEETD